MSVRLITDGAVIATMMRSPTGPVGRHLMERATVFQAAARAQAHRKTGCLQDSIVKRFVETATAFEIRVVCDTTPCSPTRTSYALFHHEGTPPHDITAKNGGLLVFDWPNGPDGPGTYYFRSVHHPGTPPNKFFTDNLHLFAA